MAERVAKWPEEYGIDGIDLDLEDGAGDTPKAGPNMIHFVRRLRQLQPKMIIGRILFIFNDSNGKCLTTMKSVNNTLTQNG